MVRGNRSSASVGEPDEGSFFLWSARGPRAAARASPPSGGGRPYLHVYE